MKILLLLFVGFIGLIVAGPVLLFILGLFVSVFPFLIPVAIIGVVGLFVLTCLKVLVK